MKKAILSLLMVSVLLVSVGMVMAKNDKPALNFGKELNANQCDKSGAPIINVVEKVANTVDSGEGGNNWAFDDLTRQIKVWEQADGTYCAIVKNEGKFDGVEGQLSPGEGGTMNGDEDGTFEGGYRATITGDLLETPLWKTKGFAQTTDYQCNLDGDCQGYVNWLGQYFESGYSFSYDFWGWIYHGGKCGTWVNADSGNLGDILCTA